MKSTAIARLACVAAAVSFAAPARAADFAGKTINFIVGSAPGGGYDTYSRVFANHYGNNLPGKPRVVLPYTGGQPMYRERCDAVRNDNFAGFAFM